MTELATLTRRQMREAQRKPRATIRVLRDGYYRVEAGGKTYSMIVGPFPTFDEAFKFDALALLARRV